MPAGDDLRQRFDDAYDRLILGREFVEYRDYYVFSRERFWNAVRRVDRLDMPAGGQVLDIGGGQFAILCRALFGADAAAADVNERAAADVLGQGLSFEKLNLADIEAALHPETAEPARRYHVIGLLEVIEHIPLPPYLVLARLARLLEPGGSILLSTPNGYRIRNILYMFANRPVLDNFRFPGPDENMGHQMEYTLGQMLWQARRAGLEVVFAELYDEGWAGSTPLRRLAKTLVRPVNLVPHLRNGLIMGLRRPV